MLHSMDTLMEDISFINVCNTHPLLCFIKSKMTCNSIKIDVSASITSVYCIWSVFYNGEDVLQIEQFALVKQLAPFYATE